MSNTDWYAQLEATQPWKAFKDYTKAVTITVAFAKSEQVTMPVLAPTTLALDGIASLAQSMLDSLPPAARKPRARRCAGLPRVYPKFWMHRPESNSLMFEFKTLQNMPSNGLRSWKD